MPAIETIHLRQKAVLWAFAGYDGNGEPTVAAPVEIPARWLESETKTIEIDQTLISVDAVVDVDRDIAKGSILWLGEQADLPSPVASDLFEVVASSKIPDIKARRVARSVTVRRWRTGLPTVV